MSEYFKSHIDNNKGNIVIELFYGTEFIYKTVNLWRDIVNEYSNTGFDPLTPKRRHLKVGVLREQKNKYDITENDFKEAKKAESNMIVTKKEEVEKPLNSGTKQVILEHVTDQLVEYTPEKSTKLVRAIERNSHIDGNKIIVGSDGKINYWFYLEHRFTNSWDAKNDRVLRGVGKQSEIMPPLKTTKLVTDMWINNYLSRVYA